MVHLKTVTVRVLRTWETKRYPVPALKISFQPSKGQDRQVEALAHDNQHGVPHAKVVGQILDATAHGHSFQPEWAVLR